MYGWYPLPFPLGGGTEEVPGPHCVQDADGFPVGLVDGDGYSSGGTPTVGPPATTSSLEMVDGDGFPVGLVDGDGGCCEGICGGA